MYQKLVRKEVMGILEKEVGSFLEKFLTPIEKNLAAFRLFTRSFKRRI